MNYPAVFCSVFQALCKLGPTLLILVSMHGCATDMTIMNDPDKNMAWLNNANPQADAQAALDKNDYRFMALALRGVVIPGVEQSRSLQLEMRCGVIMMQGISDTVRSDGHLKLMKKAHDYASQYNAVILTRCNP